MEREDFKEVTSGHIKIAKRIVKQGNCKGINCVDCQFYNDNNNIAILDCSDYKIQVTLAKQFLELFDKPKEKSLNFYERLSATIFKKQILFKQDDGIYYNKNIHDTMTKSEVKEWLLAEVGELCKDE